MRIILMNKMLNTMLLLGRSVLRVEDFNSKDLELHYRRVT